MSNTDVRYSTVTDEVDIEIEQTETPSPVLTRSGGPFGNVDHSNFYTFIFTPIFACAFYSLILITIMLYDLTWIKWDIEEIVRQLNITL